MPIACVMQFYRCDPGQTSSKLACVLSVGCSCTLSHSQQTLGSVKNHRCWHLRGSRLCVHGLGMTATLSALSAPIATCQLMFQKRLDDPTLCPIYEYESATLNSSLIITVLPGSNLITHKLVMSQQHDCSMIWKPTIGCTHSCCLRTWQTFVGDLHASVGPASPNCVVWLRAEAQSR
jgi:hypothetical protein